jgi:hypothetical protein
MAEQDKTLAKAQPQAFDVQLDQETMTKMVESYVTTGDVSRLSPADRTKLYFGLCEATGLNAATNPILSLKLNGKEIFYFGRGATDQMAAKHRLNREIVEGPELRDIGGKKIVYAKCRATHPNGRVETAVATLLFADASSDYMKCETKAKRRATLAILGLGMLDELEIDAIQEQTRVNLAVSAGNGSKEPAAYKPADDLSAPEHRHLIVRIQSSTADQMPQLYADIHAMEQGKRRTAAVAAFRTVAQEHRWKPEKPAKPDAEAPAANDPEPAP